MSIVIKYGGNAMTDATVRSAVAWEISRLAQDGLEPVVVHGGGPQIKAALDAAGVAHEFVRGLRVTTAESLPIIEQTLTLLGKALAQEIGNAIGLTGRDAEIIKAEKFDENLGFVGRMKSVNAEVLRKLLRVQLTPVIACLAENKSGQGVLNVNADEVAGAVAGALGAPVVFLTNVVGVLRDPRDASSVIGELTAEDAQAQIEAGSISGGMIPKVEAALEALAQGASYAVIADGADVSQLRAAIEGKAGTRVVRGEA
jgi:acetylglutamate kinase